MENNNKLLNQNMPRSIQTSRDKQKNRKMRRHLINQKIIIVKEKKRKCLGAAGSKGTKIRLQLKE